MARAFDEQERSIVGARLLERGEELFGRLGVAKTSVEDLTSAAGISKGAFYSFFPSKEALAWQILRGIEAMERVELRRIVGSRASAATLARAIRHALAAAVRRPFVLRLLSDPRELDAIARRLPSGASEEHLRSDHLFVEELRRGRPFALDPAVATGMLRALFLVAARGEEVAGAAYPAVEGALVSAVVRALFARGARR